MGDEVHIVGLLVQTFPERLAAIADAVSAIPEAEVRASAGNGKLVVVCECEGGERALALIAHLRGLPGVLDVSLVYQHAESAAALEQDAGVTACR
jgi:periplasmic nitrate reductase NapD